MRAFGYEVRVCSRCSGYATGLLGLAALRNSTAQLFQALPLQTQFTICMLLVIPLIADWLTQSWGLRESNNVLRFATGLMLGADVLLYSMIGLPQFPKNLFFVFTAFTVAFLGLEGLNLRK